TQRAAETEWLVIIYYELGRAELAQSNTAAALAHLKNAVRTDRTFLPAALALGDAYEATGDRREAVRVWERAAEAQPALPLLVRLERGFREEGRPRRMIALYQQALERAPDEPALRPPGLRPRVWQRAGPRPRGPPGGPVRGGDRPHRPAVLRRRGRADADAGAAGGRGARLGGGHRGPRR